MNFSFESVEWKKFVDWDKDHYPKCKYYDDGTKAESPQGAIGGRLTYSFTPTSIGVIVIVECACGAKINCTDFSSW